MVESQGSHFTVVDVLAAIIREQTRDPHRSPFRRALGCPHSATDVQAALTVLGRRPARPEARPIDLSEARLRRVSRTWRGRTYAAPTSCKRICRRHGWTAPSCRTPN